MELVTEQIRQDHRHSSCLPRERSGAYAEDSGPKRNEIEDLKINLPTHPNQRNLNDCGSTGTYAPREAQKFTGNLKRGDRRRGGTTKGRQIFTRTRIGPTL